MKGKVDRIYEENGQLKISDWKTGRALEGDINEGYEVQLQLYAALIECKQNDLKLNPVLFPNEGVLENPETGDIARGINLDPKNAEVY